MTEGTDQEAERLRELFAQPTAPTQAAFAREHGIPGGPSMISQHLSGNRPLSVEAAVGYARGFRVPLESISIRIAEQIRAAAYTLQGNQASTQRMTTGGEQAQYMSPQAHTVPLQIAWEDMMLMSTLPAEFVLVMPDDALAGRFPQGCRIIFERGGAPKVGKPVLVADAAGVRYVRIYGNVRGAKWQAIALDPAHATLDSEDDQLVVLAVARWVEL